jgi:hypothetical protein
MNSQSSDAKVELMLDGQKVKRKRMIQNTQPIQLASLEMQSPLDQTLISDVDIEGICHIEKLYIIINIQC